tara:strand:- start:18 stop:317 length:300 start_codon:yes stop_codon:yes gene_type:complete
MCTYRDKLKMEGLSSSLEDNPCISVCTTTYGTGETCICGRSTKEIAEWNSYNTLEKKEVVMKCLKDKNSYPRQRLTFLANENNLNFNEAKNVFVKGTTK